MRWGAAGLALACLAAWAGAARAGTREDVARHWAPVLFQETNDPVKDFFAAYDFDHDWNGDDNAENMECWSDSSKCTSGDDPSGKCGSRACPLVATVYFTVIETATHWFVQYMPYHPLDYKLTNGHEHDTESVLMVVKKDGSPFGALQAMETRFHISWYQYASDPSVTDGADNVDGPIHLEAQSKRPAVYSQMVGHGLCGGFSPPNRAFPDLSLTCLHDQEPHVDQTGIVYSPDLPATTTPTIVDMQATPAGYQLVELFDSVWPHIDEIGAGKAFQAAMDFTGERCGMPFACPKQYGGNWEGNEGTSPGEPWAQEGGNGVSATGDQFFDPAYTMSKRLTFAQPFSLDYCFNPYLGVADTCPDSGTPDSGLPAGDSGSGADGGAPPPPARDAGAPSDDAGGPADQAPGAAGSSTGCGCRAAASSDAVWAPAALLLACALGAGRRRLLAHRRASRAGRRAA